MLLLKNHSIKSYFSRLQFRSKDWFTSIYFLQILTKHYGTPLIREHLSLKACWFPYARTQKIRKKIFLEKLIRKKMQKIFVVNNNNNKIIRPWYLSSKWPVCRSIINQTTGGTSRTKLRTLLKTNIFKYCALFCNKVANIHFQFNSNNEEMHFVLFQNYSLLTGEQN